MLLDLSKNAMKTTKNVYKPIDKEDKKKIYFIKLYNLNL